MARVAVMLRAVNVGGRRLVMADFKAALSALGHEAPETVVATGNAVVGVTGAAGPKLEAVLEAGLEQHLGGPSEVFVRNGEELAAIVAGNPFPQMAKDDPSHLVVVFLKGQPTAEAVAALRGKIVGPEEVAAGPGCLYATYPDDLGHSKLTGAVIERALKLRGTVRNWNTVTKLATLTG
jgi:uncharacterized protein (DUF1697 family)